MIGNRSENRTATAADTGAATTADAAIAGIGRTHRLLIGRPQLGRLRGAIRVRRTGLLMDRSGVVMGMRMQAVPMHMSMTHVSLSRKRHELNGDQCDRRRHHPHELRCQHHADALPPVQPDG
ncbi:MAG: hypothetical protein ACOY4O_03090 [Pseudomonadota bacterium]